MYELNSLWPSGSIWQHKSGSTLHHLMISCLLASSHHQNQRRLIIENVLWHSSRSNFARSAHELKCLPCVQRFVFLSTDIITVPGINMQTLHYIIPAESTLYKITAISNFFPQISFFNHTSISSIPSAPWWSSGLKLLFWWRQILLD